MALAASVPPRPRLLVGSSTEDRRIAELLKAGLDDVADITLWCRGVFEPAARPLDGVLDATREFDFAAFVMAPDDLAPKRQPKRRDPADNVTLQLGVFLGALGRQRTFIVCSTATTVELPSDLRGVVLATYRPSGHGNVQAALGCACTILKEQIRRLMPPTAAASAAARMTSDPPSQVARRRRRGSLGTGSLASPKRVLQISDLSLTGALLESYGELPENQLLDLELTLEDGSRVRVTARVVRVQHPQWGRVGGVGVTFVRFEGDSQEILARYVDADPALTTEAAGASTSR